MTVKHPPLMPSTVLRYAKWVIEAEPNENGCIIWPGTIDATGYGRCTINAGNSYAHRCVFELFHGEIPSGMVVRHSCDTPTCVNPDHLLVGSQLDNVADRELRGRTARGERTGVAVLSEQTVRFIRQNHSPYGRNGMSATALAKLLGVSEFAIAYVVNKIGWRHVA